MVRRSGAAIPALETRFGRNVRFPRSSDHPPAQFKSPDGTWTGAAARAKILLVNTQRVAAADMPRSIRDLANPRWKGQGAIANPVFGTTTMYVAALFTVWGEERGKAFLQGVKENGTRVASSNGEVRRLVATGEVSFGLTDGHPVAEITLMKGAQSKTVSQPLD
ncbi:MAG: ABC transporter substrate-binding protein [Myxococcales bacterium]